MGDWPGPGEWPAGIRAQPGDLVRRAADGSWEIWRDRRWVPLASLRQVVADEDPSVYRTAADMVARLG